MKGGNEVMAWDMFTMHETEGFDIFLVLFLFFCEFIKICYIILSSCLIRQRRAEHPI
jgi:hypothetical protein